MIQNWGKDDEQKSVKEVGQKPGRWGKAERIELGDSNPTNRNEEIHRSLRCRTSTQENCSKKSEQGTLITEATLPPGVFSLNAVSGSHGGVFGEKNRQAIYETGGSY